MLLVEPIGQRGRAAIGSDRNDRSRCQRRFRSIC